MYRIGTLYYVMKYTNVHSNNPAMFCPSKCVLGTIGSQYIGTHWVVSKPCRVNLLIQASHVDHWGNRAQKL